MVTLSFSLCVICTFCKFIFLNDAQDENIWKSNSAALKKNTHTHTMIKTTEIHEIRKQTTTLKKNLPQPKRLKK